MSKRNLWIFGLMLAGMNTSVLANSAVIVPSQKVGIKVGIDALYLQASNSDLNYGTRINFLNADSSIAEKNAWIDPAYQWGYYAQIGYLFPCTGNDLTLGYTHISTSDNGEIIRPEPLGSGGVFSFPGLSVEIPPEGNLPIEVMHQITAQGRFDLNAADLEGGQRFVASAFNMRMFAGLRYANIDNQLSMYSLSGLFSLGDQQTIDVTLQEKFRSHFSGFGPRLGVEGRYCLSSGFGLDAQASGALLIGELDSQYNAHGGAILTGQEQPQTTSAHVEDKNDSETRIVPNIDVKLGVDYTYPLCAKTRSALVFEAGYQASNYFNAISKPTILNIIDGSPVSQATTSDMGFDGVYFGVKYYA